MFGKYEQNDFFVFVCHNCEDIAPFVDVKKFVVTSPGFAHPELYGVFLVKHNYFGAYLYSVGTQDETLHQSSVTTSR